MSREARARYLEFAVRPDATWPGNFRDLDASVTRMATLAPGGRISAAEVDEEIRVLRVAFSAARPASAAAGAEARIAERVLGVEAARALDRFDLVQLEDVLGVAARASSLSEAGRVLFSESRKQKASTNDADRLRKFLARFDLSFADVQARLGGDTPAG